MVVFERPRPDLGKLEVEVGPNGTRAIVSFVATAQALKDAGRSGAEYEKVTIAEIEMERSVLRVFPLNTLAGSDSFLDPKYEQLRAIELPLDLYGGLPTTADEVEDILRELPRGFTKDYQYGLGLPRDYRAIVDSIESNTSCTEIVISSSRESGVSGAAFVLSPDSFERVRVEMDRIVARARSAASRVKKSFVLTELASHFGIEPVPVSRGKHPVTQFITDELTGRLTLDTDEQDVLLAAAINQSKMIAETRPEALIKLRKDVELVSLATLIAKYEGALTAKKGESFWQDFFTTNPFSLHLVFGYSIVKVEDQASVGGKRLDGRGEKIVDFLVKNALTNNVGIFEIKKPKTPLLRAKPYRDGIYGPSNELAGAVSQVLDQRYQLQRSLVALKETTKNWDLEQYSLRCCLIIGLSPSDPVEQKSFELFRYNLKEVDVITYDELLAKLVQLRDFLSDEEPAVRPIEADEAVPDGEGIVE